MSITDKLQTLKNTKQAIKQALIDKGVEVSDSDDFASYAEKIENIESSGTSASNTVAGLSIDNFIAVDDAGAVTQKANKIFECNAAKVGSSAFRYIMYGNSNITEVNFPNLISSTQNSVFDYAFAKCTNLTSVSFPLLTTLDAGSGSYNYSTDEYTNVMSNTFKDCINLTSVNFPSLTTITFDYVLADAFKGCTSLTTISFPKLKNIREGSFYRTFYNCTNLSTINFPKLESIGYKGLQSAFFNTKVNTLDLISLKGSISALAFSNNSKLKKVWIPKEVTTIKTNTNSTSDSYTNSPFYNCSPELIIYTDASEKLEGWSDYCFYVSSSVEATVVYGATHEDFENETLPSNYPILTINIPNGATVQGTYMKNDVTSNVIKMFPNTSITLRFTLDGYLPLVKTYTIYKDNIIDNITISDFTAIPDSYDLHYDYTNQEHLLGALVDGTYYQINDSNKGISCPASQQQLGNTLGYYGYLQITPTEDVTLSVTSKYAQYSSSYVYGCYSIYVGTEIYNPTNDQIYSNKKDDYGNYLERGYGGNYYQNGNTKSLSNSSTFHTSSITLSANTTYYICFAVTRYGSSWNCGTFTISDIVTTPIGE